jgi:hypothetical protein
MSDEKQSNLQRNPNEGQARRRKMRKRVCVGRLDQKPLSAEESEIGRVCKTRQFWTVSEAEAFVGRRDNADKGIYYIDVPEQVVIDKKWAMAQLKSKGINNVEVIYSGGHDEGGTDEILVYYEDGRKDTWDESEVPVRTYDWHLQKWNQPEMTDQQHLIDQLVKPVYDEYGGFAGESYYNGKIIWNVAENTVVNSGNYTNEI